ncbi:MAG: PmoA family protein, partial [Thermodesulfobacteriota bacterium]|nr:PmoA family protein [Thermodesulfobacteriota bacterium]
MRALWMFFVLVAMCAAIGLLWRPGAASASVTVKELPGRFRVEVDGDLFAEYVFEGYAKPIIYPVIGPHGIGMTRNWPMKEVPGEAHDHKHHKSLWYTHGDVNGIDFWGEGDRSGKIVQEKVLKMTTGPRGAVILAADEWRGPDQNVVCTDTRRVGFSAFPRGRMIDFDITIFASNGDVVFGDTKEGTMGIRTHPNLRLRNDPSRGVTTANGHALNSEGVRDKDLWGKRAKWVDYWGTIGGHVVGVAIFDHPSNPRHPTWWHARDYGLIAANPFGVHDFEGKPEGTGDLKIPAGERRRWRYRFVFHEGDAEEADVAELYEDFAASRSPDALEPTTAGGAAHAEADADAWAIVGLEGASHRRLFLDPLVVEKKSGVERVFHACDKYPGNPVLVGDTPWESGGSGPYLYGTVMWDQHTLRMWYHFFRDGGYRNAYAESSDGIDWKKPDVGIIAFEG